MGQSGSRGCGLVGVDRANALRGRLSKGIKRSRADRKPLAPGQNADDNNKRRGMDSNGSGEANGSSSRSLLEKKILMLEREVEIKEREIESLREVCLKHELARELEDQPEEMADRAKYVRGFSAHAMHICVLFAHHVT